MFPSVFLGCNNLNDMYYNVVMAFEEENEKGAIKIRKESYLIKDLDPTAATAHAVDKFGSSGTFRVVSVVETKFRDVSLDPNS